MPGPRWSWAKKENVQSSSTLPDSGVSRLRPPSAQDGGGAGRGPDSSGMKAAGVCRRCPAAVPSASLVSRASAPPASVPLSGTTMIPPVAHWSVQAAGTRRTEQVAMIRSNGACPGAPAAPSAVSTTGDIPRPPSRSRAAAVRRSETSTVTTFSVPASRHSSAAL